MNGYTSLVQRFDREKFLALNEEISFSEYIDRVWDNPRIIRTAYQRMYDMIMHKGSSEFTRYRKTLTHYHFFDDTEIPIFGLDETLNNLVKFIKGAAGGYGTEKRILLLHGPVGSSKSTICRLLKRGLERYSRIDDGAWYSFKWVDLPTGSNGISISEEDECPMHEEPLKLLTGDVAASFLNDINKRFFDSVPEKERHNAYKLKLIGELDPRCKKYLFELLRKYNGDLQKVLDGHIRVIRKVHSEIDRCGIGTFQPKDEKNQDSTELTGDISWNKIQFFGSDSDPRAFNLDGEFPVGNRGCVEFIEIYKLQKEFLYDILGATQEQNIKPKKFPQVAIDTVLIGHTNNPEFIKVQQDQYMEALKDRTVKIDVPYLLEWSKEIKIYEQDYGPDKVRQHVAPHTKEIAALWSCLTRAKDHDGVDLVQKIKLLDGQSLPNWSEDKVKEMKDKHLDEGMSSGMSPRYVQDCFSKILSEKHDYINAFNILNEIKEGLKRHSIYSENKDVLKRYLDCYDIAVKELTEILKDEVQRALVADENAIVRLCANYVDNLMASVEGSKVTNKFTGREEEPNEQLMRSIEEKINIPDSGASDFRKMIQGYMGRLSHEHKEFQWNSNPLLKKALEAKLFEDTKDHIKISALHVSGATVVDKDLQEKIDALVNRMCDKFGYNEQSARDVLDHVGSIFARGDLAKED